ncbi:MAG: hypothetical protein RR101_14465 [Burkholderiaceae bacterium]
MSLKKVTLIKPHTHAGRAYPVAAEIDIDAADAAWLADAGVIAPVPAATTKPPAKVQA